MKYYIKTREKLVGKSSNTYTIYSTQICVMFARKTSKGCCQEHVAEVQSRYWYIPTPPYPYLAKGLPSARKLELKKDLEQFQRSIRNFKFQILSIGHEFGWVFLFSTLLTSLDRQISRFAARAAINHSFQIIFSNNLRYLFPPRALNPIQPLPPQCPMQMELLKLHRYQTSPLIRSFIRALVVNLTTLKFDNPGIRNEYNQCRKRIKG